MNIFELFGKIGIDNKSANKAIDETTKKAEGAHGKLSAVFGKIGQLATKAGNVMATGLAIGITALAGLTGAATKHYAEYEQLVGGIETLFGAGGQSLEEYAQSVGKSVSEASAEYNKLINAQEEIVNKSKIAYKTAGLSANQYMETATSFSASLIQSVGGDTEKAAKLADQAIIDMSDNANKMGSSMESIQNAYQGFAKQNYTMLDNLKLGYGGTKEEMQRLLDDAEKISGIKYDISSFADVTEAIHVMQEEMGIAGTTSKEAASTISGSVAMVKASWENFLTGMADPDQDFGELVGGLTDSIGIALDNIIPRLVETLPRLIEGLSQVIITLSGYLPEILGALLPGLVEGAAKLLTALGATLPALFDTLFNQVLPQVAEAFERFLEQVFSAEPGSFDGLSTAFDELIGVIETGAGKVADFISWFEKGGPTVDAFKAAIVGVTTAWAGYKVVTGTIQAIETVRNTLLAVGNGLMLARFVQSGALTAAEATQAAATMGASGAFGIFNAVLAANPIMIVIMAITALVAALVWFFTQTETGRQMWQGFVDFLGNAWTVISTTAQGVWNALSAFLSGIWSAIVSFAQSYFNMLVAFYSGIWNAISSTISAVWNGIASFLSGLWNGIYSTASSIFNNISSTISSVMDGISSTVSRVWNGIKDTISNAINGAKDAVSNAIEAIKGLFNFEFKWPHLKMPHFSFSGSMNPLEWADKGVPSIGVEWYAKGGIMNGPTVFGMNGNNAMVGGEAGPEAVLPLNDKTLGAIGQGIAESSDFSNQEIMAVLFEILSVLKAIYDKDGSVYIDSDKLIGHIWKKLRDKFSFEDNVDLIFRRGT